MALFNVAWGARHETSFKDLQNKLQNEIKQVCSKQRKVVYIFTDASDKFWAVVVTQINPDQVKIERIKQRHELFALLEGGFSRAQRN